MPADGGEVHADRIDELTDAMLAPGQLADDPQAGRMPERFEHFRFFPTTVFIIFQHNDPFIFCYLAI